MRQGGEAKTVLLTMVSTNDNDAPRITEWYLRKGERK